jgi:hypothetical protein
MLNKMELPIGSSKAGLFLQLGGGLQMGQIRCPLHKERVAHTKLHCRISEREITLLTEMIGLLQKTELLENSITANFSRHAPRQTGKDGLRHDYERHQRWA